MERSVRPWCETGTVAGQTFLSEHFSQGFFPTKVIPTEFSIVKDNKNIFILKSYCTDILVIYKDKLYRASDTNEGDFSSTTLKHCRSFVNQYIISDVCHKKEFLALDTININDLLLDRI